MRARCRMHLAECRQSCGLNSRGEPSEGWPQPAMHVSDLAIDEAADKYVPARANMASQLKERLALRVPPPAAPMPRAQNSAGQAGHTASGSFKHHAVQLYKSKCLIPCQQTLPNSSADPSGSRQIRLPLAKLFEFQDQPSWSFEICGTSAPGIIDGRLNR